MTRNMSEKWSHEMPTGLGLEISHHPLTMRSVVNLVIAMERLKGSQGESALSTEFRHENLLNIMMEDIVEGEHRQTPAVVSAPACVRDGDNSSELLQLVLTFTNRSLF